MNAIGPREQLILDQLQGKGVVQVHELSEHLNVSEVTIRRDLTAMEDKGLLLRVHGGATLAGMSRKEPVFRDKESAHLEAKSAIARAAFELIKDGDMIYLDGGSTVLQLAKLLDSRQGLTIVTNSIMAAANLMDTEHRLILVGGEFRQLSRTLVGPLTERIINSLHVNVAFMGTIGFDLTSGMTTTDPNEAHTKELIMKRAGKVVLLADGSKLGTSSFAQSGNLTDLDALISEQIPDSIRDALERLHIQVIKAE